ncbi:MAG TPA: bifunctional UDP-N-acetylglucosamine diphosphorylase/glucosamine-1-phosphate N-acetyltransferase GlmU [Burkholderiales bacterium]|jgi:bifunctional UDP-N-acetylglucosamine pyrophosphorylase/glucosamine-1-phosphate N-acetyltransferase|nr:bifunctional UDP-N-acetylglucosamine diphosphorylase/glucosamine-1-phosphate N-acetyltransferase GlmU [Burkholderiales bacterium]
MPDLDVVILAAGKGTRMFSDVPKVLHPLGGRPLLAHVIEVARRLRPRRIVAVCGHGAEEVRSRLAAPDVDFVLQEPQLGTAHAVQQAMPLLSSDVVLVLYGDVPLVRAQTLQRLVASRAPLTLLTVELDDPSGYGRIVRDRSGAVTRIVEEKDATGRDRAIREVSTGVMAAQRNRLGRWLARIDNDNAQGEFYLTDVAALAVKDRVSIGTVQPEAAWEVLGVNSKEQLARLERIHQWESAQALMKQGVTLADPARIDVRGELSCGRDVTIDVGCVFEGSVVLGDRVRIGANCVVRDAHVGPGTQLLPFCHLEGVTIGADCRIGPYTRVRPGTRFGDEVRVGNFVEVKASELGDRSKANHLSYLGDTRVGRNVNIGAGTITCNYDGANKHRTVIEDDAFIGSDTQLVAPVVIGKGATIGAGSTITKDAPPGELTLARAKQLSVSGWKRPTKKRA